jgi:hypothetical protein
MSSYEDEGRGAYEYMSMLVAEHSTQHSSQPQHSTHTAKSSEDEEDDRSLIDIFLNKYSLYKKVILIVIVTRIFCNKRRK